MSELNVRLRCKMRDIFRLKLYIDLNEKVIALKKLVCEESQKKDRYMDIEYIIVMYCGIVLEDDVALHTCQLFHGATVYVYQRVKYRERPLVPIPIDDNTIRYLAKNVELLLKNPATVGLLTKYCRADKVNDLLLKSPSLVDDPVAIVFVQSLELIIYFSDFEMAKRILRKHPALIPVLFDAIAPGLKKLSQISMYGDRHVPNYANNDEDNLYVSSDDEPFIGFPAPREDTAAQLTSTVTSVTAQQSQPSTSGASTSTGGMGNALEGYNNGASEQDTIDFMLSSNLEIMRKIGLTDETINIAALRYSNTLEDAIELVLHDFTNP